MTKKDYIKIAEVLKRQNAPHDLVVDMANMLYMDNPRFDTQTFLKAIEK